MRRLSRLIDDQPVPVWPESAALSAERSRAGTTASGSPRIPPIVQPGLGSRPAEIGSRPGFIQPNRPSVQPNQADIQPSQPPSSRKCTHPAEPPGGRLAAGRRRYRRRVSPIGSVREASPDVGQALENAAESAPGAGLSQLHRVGPSGMFRALRAGGSPDAPLHGGARARPTIPGFPGMGR